MFILGSLQQVHRGLAHVLLRPLDRSLTPPLLVHNPDKVTAFLKGTAPSPSDPQGSLEDQEACLGHLSYPATFNSTFSATPVASQFSPLLCEQVPRKGAAGT